MAQSHMHYSRFSCINYKMKDISNLRGVATRFDYRPKTLQISVGGPLLGRGMKVSEIGLIFGLHFRLVEFWMREYDIPVREDEVTQME